MQTAVAGVQAKAIRVRLLCGPLPKKFHAYRETLNAFRLPLDAYDEERYR